ncbi:DNA cytosine methyltransferase [Streptomyces drozdowiczii]|uniref:DNA (cytosine-5-)-methyltransferase n=1 Tax=Streptomyces drozdowiczii TaxID=202862 RepID=A0ABY6PVF2_9ACTN|nr:DNA cytosine methyltransferase [Streptomyces drozdowiczii]MCX0244019.1 DNA cytosine methyltransferase [Streptomyces drozdowiczii]UZK56143.1 DNA cytosine methyltransferase [Streptomyces drozdowiczii]
MTPRPHPPLLPASFRIVDLFAGPGGLDIAATVMGVESIGVEWDDPTRATRDAAGLRTTTEKDVAALGPCDPQVQDANVLTGGPPCQSFSVAGNREGHKALEDVKRLAGCLVSARDRKSFDTIWNEVKRETDSMSDERTGFVLQPLRWIMEAKLKRKRPYDVVVLEQVPTVLPVWKHYAELLRGIGYAADAHVLQAEAFGVPQTRRRAVLIARWDPKDSGRGVYFPEPTHRPYRKAVEQQGDALFAPPKPPKSSKDGRKKESWVSVGAALAATRPRDFVLVSNYGSGGDPKNRGRRTSEEPAATITGKFRRNRLFLLKENEAGEKEVGEELDRLSFEEGGLLQSFPARYPWRSTDVAQQIGNAIPPRLSLHILSAALLGGPPEKEWFTRLAEWKPPTDSLDKDTPESP